METRGKPSIHENTERHNTEYTESIELETGDGLRIQRKALMIDVLGSVRRNLCEIGGLTIGANTIRSEYAILANQPRLIEAVYDCRFA